jgi:hypothetical protein
MRAKHPEPPDAQLLTPEQFRATPEYRKFKGIMRRLLKVPKSELDDMVRNAKRMSPRTDNPDSPGRKCRMYAE